MFVSRVQSAAGNYVRPFAKNAAAKMSASKQFAELKFKDSFARKAILEPETMKVSERSNVRKASSNNYSDSCGYIDVHSCGLC